MLSPLTYANTIIKKALETETPLSPMKLQKLLYLTYARALHKHGELLFSEQFEKWQYGPVLRSVYDAFRCNRDQSIKKFHFDCEGKVVVVGNGFVEFYDCFEEVWDTFGHLNGIELSILTHQEGTAWRKADEPILSKEDIREDGRQLFAA